MMMTTPPSFSSSDASVNATAGKPKLQRPNIEVQTSGTQSKPSKLALYASLQITGRDGKQIDMKPYIHLVERVARVEYRRIPQHMVDYEELLSIGALAVQTLVQNKTTEELARLNISYMATATRWAIRNELRTRHKWYSQKHKNDSDELLETTDENGNPQENTGNTEETVRQAVYQTILSIDSMQTSDDGETSYDCIADKSATPEEALEITELGRAVKAAVQALPSKERHIVECRFYKNMQVKEIAAEVGLSSSRITRIVQASLDTVRQYLKNQSYLNE
jgi:RNA polymerase sigma factor (sigma-70 family)